MAEKPYALLAEFETPQALYHACEKVRDEGFRRWDAFSPFPVHGLDRAMGVPRSKLPWIVLVCGLSGAGLGFWLQAWVSASAYPVIVAGKALLSWQAFVPVTFEVGVLLGAFGAVFGMFALNGLPRLHHPLFNSDRFEAVTDDRFFIAIEADDPRYDAERTRALLLDAGAAHVELVKE